MASPGVVVHQTFFGTVASLPPGARRAGVEWVFNRRFGRQSDPWRYETTDEERERIRGIADAVTSHGNPESVLELGCAEGILSAALIEKLPGARFTGIDISPVAVQRARRRCPDAEFIVADVRAWEHDTQVDLIIMCDVLYYLGTKRMRAQFCQRVTNWLRPGGILLLGHESARANLHESVRSQCDLAPLNRLVMVNGGYTIDISRRIA